MSESWYGWLLVAGASLVVFFTRAVFILPGARLRLPPAAEKILRYAPAAALMAIVVPDTAMVHGAWAVSLYNPRFVGGLAAFAIAAATRSVTLTIVGGMAALTLVRLFLA